MKIQDKNGWLLKTNTFSNPPSCTNRMRKWQWCSISIGKSTFDSSVFHLYNTRAVRKCYTLHCFRYITKIHRKCDVYLWYKTLTHPFSHPFSHRSRKSICLWSIHAYTRWCWWHIIIYTYLWCHVWKMVLSTFTEWSLLSWNCLSH